MTVTPPGNVVLQTGFEPALGISASHGLKGRRLKPIRLLEHALYNWWTWRKSNPQSSGCGPDALPLSHKPICRKLPMVVEDRTTWVADVEDRRIGAGVSRLVAGHTIGPVVPPDRDR